jgi:ABC-2 type transport system ATP-binding protein
MSDTLISVKNLYRYYGALCAVRDVSFDIRRGEVLGFLGPNGAGKSTTMQIIAGTLAPSSGEISIAGHDLFEDAVAAKAALGYLPEQPPLYRDLTVREYLYFCAGLHNIPRAAQSSALARVIEQCGLGEVQNRLIGNISKGYQQRVGIAQAIIHSPAVVILDEPTVGLDPLQIREIRALIRALGAQHSVLLSTHILSEVQAVCNHVQIIRKGELVLADTIDGLQQRMHAGSLYVGLRRPPPEDKELLSLPGALRVERLDNFYVRLYHAAGDNPGEALAARAAANDWGLFELSPEKRSLEQVFVELAGTPSETSKEAA